MVYICAKWNPTSFIPISINSRNPIEFLLFNRNKKLFSFSEKKFPKLPPFFLVRSTFLAAKVSSCSSGPKRNVPFFFALNKPPISGERNERRKKVVNYHKRAISAITKGSPTSIRAIYCRTNCRQTGKWRETRPVNYLICINLLKRKKKCQSQDFHFYKRNFLES